MEKVGFKSKSGGPGLDRVSQLSVAGDKMTSNEWVKPMTLILGIDVICSDVATTNMKNVRDRVRIQTNMDSMDKRLKSVRAVTKLHITVKFPN